ncbi:MAG: SpoIIE family protein phosphatase [Clostridia bacterium]|nr:SpoIIE family protein phosphatase [Clostridia bacterium]
MEKGKKEQPALVISKTLGRGYEKLLFKLTASETLKTILCFVFQFSKIFSNFSPFGTAFYSAVFRSDRWVANFIGSLLGMILSHKEAFWTYGVTLLAQTAVFAMFDKWLETGLKRALVSAMLFFGFGFLRLVGFGYIAYDVMALILESILVVMSALVFSSAVTMMGTIKRRRLISESEVLSFYTTVAVFILCFQNQAIENGHHYSSVISILLIMIFCLTSEKNSSLPLAILLGTVNALGHGSGYAIMGTYPLGALIASVLKKYGKSGVVLGFVIANSASSLLLAESNEIVIGIYDCFVASVIFAIIPKKFMAPVRKLNLENSPTSPCDVSPGLSFTETSGFERISESVKELSEIYRSDFGERKISPAYIAMMTNEIKKRVCTGCDEKEKCFDQSGGIATKTVEAMLKLPLGASHLNGQTLPKNFKNVCHRCDSFAQACNHFTDIIKTESKWLTKTVETRKLVSEQLGGIAEIIQKECLNIKHSRDRQLEHKLHTELDKIEINAIDIRVQKNADMLYDIDITVPGAEVSKQLRSVVADCIEKTVHMKVSFSGIRRRGGDVIFMFSPKISYSASFGYATKAKNGEKVCGDSFNVVYTDKNKMVMVLSDGMGSGAAANGESKMTVSLLEKFLLAGFDCDTSVRLINSSLLMQGGRESFATMDICNINLTAASIEFTKFGASDAYIKSDGNITRVKGCALPVGILRETKGQKHMLSLEGDTIVILMSDGVADISLRESVSDDWIGNLLTQLKSNNPQIIAGKLLEKATQLQKGKVSDDMTVLVACITKEKNKV